MYAFVQQLDPLSEDKEEEDISFRMNDDLS